MGNLSLSVSSVGQTTATISWTVSGMVQGDFAWDVFVYGGGGTISQQGLSYSQASASNSASVTGLSPGTTYTFLADLNTQNGNVGYQTKSITVTTQAAPVTYTGSWNLNGGSGGGPYPTSVTAGGSISAPSSPSQSGYNFAGWSVGFPYTPTGSGWSISASWNAVATYPPSWTDTALASAQIGTAYSDGVSATNMNYSGSYSVSAGSLPAGLSLNTGSGAITGTPTVSGTFNFTISANNSYGSISQAFTFVVNAIPATGNANVWNGTGWVSAPVYVYNGTTWVLAPVYAYNGSSWVMAI